MIKKNRMIKTVMVMAMVVLMAGINSVGALAAPATENVPDGGSRPAPTEFAHILSCAIEGGNQIAIRGQMEGTWSDASVYDNYLYLFELQPYQDDLTGRSDYCGWITKGEELSFTIPLNLGTEQNRLLFPHRSLLWHLLQFLFHLL